MALLQPKVPFWVFPCACWTPFFVVFGDFEWAPKMDHFPKTDSYNENARFFCTFRTQIVFAYFLKHAILTKKTFFFTTPKKHCFFLVFFFFLFSFSMFSSFLFWFIQHKKGQKQKMHFIFSKPFFWRPDKLPKNLFAPLHTICVF